jgi:eukaryotic-like serine/threonine-protein kinase
MASVLLCHDERLDRQVAVKRLHSDSPAEVEQRFVREAKLGASLSHPNLVPVYDTAVEDEGLLIVMEYVEGESLAQALLRGPLEPRRVAGIAGDLGDALDHVHAQGVVHRDVKPANVLLRHDGAVKLVDLGIAVSADQTRVTRSGVVLGSAGYMAPEQLDGREVGPAADIYALATVCFEALCGRRARAGRTPVEIAHEIATAEPPDVREHAPGLPPAAADSLARGMARDPGRRQRSAGELAAQLASGLERRPGPTRRRGFAGALAMGLLALAVAAVAAVVLLNGGGGGNGDSQRAGQHKQSEAQGQGGARQKSQAPADTTPAQPAPAEPAPPAGATSGAALNEQGFELMGRGDFAGAVPILRRAVASWPEDSTDLEYAYALYNLGTSLNRSGQAAEAIPYLEKRLNWSNQRGVVKKELKLARKNAGQG